MKKVIVSACLLGENCKYSGGNNYDPKVAEFIRGREVIPVCPEVLAGLGIPRTPIEIRNGRVISRDGVDVDDAVRAAVAEILSQIQEEDIECAILKARSPTCGVRQVYDGSFTGTLVDGAGVLAQALRNAGYQVMDNEMLEEKKMQEYELCVEAMNPCGGSQYARREILEVETDDPVAYVRQNAMFPILDVAACEDLIIVTTGDGHGYVTRYSFTK